ncbi:MAG: hypothetical protein QM754_02700 [Tepidisphaeraceae bacterium]
MPDDANDDTSPVDYFNPRAEPEPVPVEPVVERPAAVIPAEFDAVLTRSDDHAGVAAVEAALGAMKIRYHRAAGGEVAKREIALFVRHADLEAASIAAARVFARRARVKAMNKPQPADTDPDSSLFYVDPLP